MCVRISCIVEIYCVKDNKKIKRPRAAELSSLIPRSALKKGREFITRGQCSDEFSAIIKTSRSSNVTFDRPNYHGARTQGRESSAQ